MKLTMSVFAIVLGFYMHGLRNMSENFADLIFDFLTEIDIQFPVCCNIRCDGYDRIH